MGRLMQGDVVHLRFTFSFSFGQLSDSMCYWASNGEHWLPSWQGRWGTELQMQCCRIDVTMIYK